MTKEKDDLKPEIEVIPTLSDEEIRKMVLDEWERKLDMDEDNN